MPGLPSAPAEFQVASTCPKAIVGLASVAFAVAGLRKPTVMIDWQPWSMQPLDVAPRSPSRPAPRLKKVL